MVVVTIGVLVVLGGIGMWFLWRDDGVEPSSGDAALSGLHLRIDELKRQMVSIERRLTEKDTLIAGYRDKLTSTMGNLVAARAEIRKLKQRTIKSAKTAKTRRGVG